MRTQVDKITNHHIPSVFITSHMLQSIVNPSELRLHLNYAWCFPWFCSGSPTHGFPHAHDMEVKSSPEAEMQPVWQDAQAQPAMLTWWNGMWKNWTMFEFSQTPPEWKKYETPPPSEEPEWHAQNKFKHNKAVWSKSCCSFKWLPWQSTITTIPEFAQ